MSKLLSMLQKAGQSKLAQQVMEQISENPGKIAGITGGGLAAGYAADAGANKYADIKRKEIILQNLGYGIGAAGVAGLGALSKKLLESPTTQSMAASGNRIADSMEDFQAFRKRRDQGRRRGEYE